MAEKGRKNLLKSVGLLTVLVVVSKVFALTREMVIAAVYGVSESTDAYFLASGFISNVFYGINAALATVFLPYYVGVKERDGRLASRQMSSSLLYTLSVIAAAVMAALCVAAPLVVRLLAPTYSEQTLSEAVLYMRIYSVTILFSLLTNMLTCVLNAESRYGYGAVAALLYSVTSIACMLLLAKTIGVAALAISVPLSFFIQLLILAWKTRPFVSFRFHMDFKQPALKHLLMLALPVLLGNATTELNEMLTRSIASTTGSGSVSIMNYGNTLTGLVTSMLSSTFLTVYFTEFSHLYTMNDREGFSDMFHRAIKVLCLLLIPICAITYLFSNDIVGIVYMRGAFDAYAAEYTAKYLSIYIFCILSYGVRYVCSRAFYSSGNTRIPMVNSILTLVLTAASAMLLVSRYGILGIALAATITSVLCTVFLLLMANRRLLKIRFLHLARAIGKDLVAAIPMLAVLVLFGRAMAGKSYYVRFFGATAIGMAVYFTLLWLLRCEELREVLGMLLSRVKRGHRKSSQVHANDHSNNEIDHE